MMSTLSVLAGFASHRRHNSPATDTCPNRHRRLRKQDEQITRSHNQSPGWSLRPASLTHHEVADRPLRKHWNVTLYDTQETSRMNYYGAKPLADGLRTVRKNTLIIAEEIPEDRYGFRAAPETRTVAQTLTHIAVAPRMPEQIHAVERRITL